MDFGKLGLSILAYLLEVEDMKEGKEVSDGIYFTKKTRSVLLRRSLFFILFSFLSFIAPPYLECQDVYSDDWSDFFVITDDSVDIATIRRDRLAVSSFSDFIPDGHTFQRHNSEGPYLQPLVSKLVLSVTLRC
jgi:hypothetical protein